MPRIIDLGRLSDRLRDVNLIVGEGLCSNIYVVGKEQVVVVDTGVGNYANPVWPQLDKLGIKPEKVAGVILTHAHHDHASGVFIILKKVEPKVYIHRLDTKYIASHLGSNLIKVEDGDTIVTPKWPLHVIWTPGHTAGGICLYTKNDRILFSGDTIFPDGYYGRYDGESGSLKAIIESLKRLIKLEVDIMLPGHGMPVLEGAGNHIRMAYVNAARHA